MKPLLIIVLAIALIAAILLGVVIIKNKNTEKNEVIFQSDFGVSNTTAWARNGVDNVEYLQEADGYFARVKSSENNQTASLISEPFALEPDAEYELSFYLRIPDESEAFINGEKYIAPAICLYQTEINENGSTVSSAAKVSATTNNIYAYNGVRRDDFSAVWQIEGFEPYPVTGLSILTSDHQYDILGIDTDLKTAYSSWKKITAKFTGVADADNTYPQMVAVSFGYSALPKNGYIFDVKKVELIKMANETTVEPDPESFVYYQDFEDEDALESAVEFL